MTKEDFESFFNEFLKKNRGEDHIGADWNSNLFECGALDSLSLVLLINEIEMVFEKKLAPDSIQEKNFCTKENLYNYLTALM